MGRGRRRLCLFFDSGAAAGKNFVLCDKNATVRGRGNCQSGRTGRRSASDEGLRRQRDRDRTGNVEQSSEVTANHRDGAAAAGKMRVSALFEGIARTIIAGRRSAGKPLIRSHRGGYYRFAVALRSEGEAETTDDRWGGGCSTWGPESLQRRSWADVSVLRTRRARLWDASR